MVCLGLLAFVPETIEDSIMLKKAHRVFVKGNTVKRYKKKSNVFDTHECMGVYTIIGVKGDYVCLKNIETGEATEFLISILCKYSDRCEVFSGDTMVALFQYRDQKFYKTEIREINPNCN